MDKESMINLVYIILLIIGLIIYYRKEHIKRKFSKKVKKTLRINSDGAHFINKMEQLGYFQFTFADQLESLKTEIKTTYEKHGVLATIEIDHQPVCNRLFSADAEYLFEEGGFIDMLNNLKPAFEIRGLRLDINEHFEQYQDDLAEQWVILNDRKYVIYDSSDRLNANWGLATKILVGMLNKELMVQGSHEQFYCISGGNDGRIILLTSEQYDFLSRSKINVDWKPHGCKDLT